MMNDWESTNRLACLLEHWHTIVPSTNLSLFLEINTLLIFPIHVWKFCHKKFMVSFESAQTRCPGLIWALKMLPMSSHKRIACLLDRANIYIFLNLKLNKNSHILVLSYNISVILKLSTMHEGVHVAVIKLIRMFL